MLEQAGRMQGWQAALSARPRFLALLVIAFLLPPVAILGFYAATAMLVALSLQRLAIAKVRA